MVVGFETSAVYKKVSDCLGPGCRSSFRPFRVKGCDLCKDVLGCCRQSLQRHRRLR